MIHHKLMDGGETRAVASLLELLARHEQVRRWRRLDLGRALA
jgi:hypothetical protein